jgi:aryl-alcohol dehydrogenase-like predicted oxidoreductase
MKRRHFLRTAAAIAGAGALTDKQTAAGDESKAPSAEPRKPTADMPLRMLGRTGEKVSMIGLGGFHIGTQPDAAESVRIIRAAIDGGITFLDNCWDYNNGQSEIRMGQALRDGYRQRVFLMSKFDGRTKAIAARQIDESLKRLQTDRIDLMQYHEVIRLEDPDRFFEKGGAREALDAAVKAGKVRFVGFTGHKDPLVHLRLLGMAKERGYRFDAVQMPLNVMDAHFRSFEREVLPVLVKEEIAVLGMKPLGSGDILKSGTVQPIQCLHYALNLPVSTVITGIDSMQILQQALEAARTFKPLSDEALAGLLERTKVAALSGDFEKFKTGTQFDATARNPDWIG